MRLHTLLAVIVLVAIGYFLAVATRQWGEKRGKESSNAAPPADTPTRKTEKQTPKDVSQLQHIFAVAERLQKFSKWQEAAEKYKEAQENIPLSEADAELVRKKLDAVRNVIHAEALTAEKKWDEAVVAYEAALNEIESKAFVEKAITRAGAERNVEEQREKGEKLAREGKWAEAQAAFREAHKTALKADIPSHALERAREIENLSRNEEANWEGMLRVFDACAKNDNLYAILAACNYFGQNPAYAGLKDTIETRKAECLITISDRPQDFPPLASTADTQVVTLQNKDGAVVEGTPIGEEGSKLLLNVLEGTRLIPKVVVKESSAKVSRKTMSAKNLNEARAEQLFGAVIKSIGRDDHIGALTVAGCLQHQFPESKVLVDTARQEWVTGATSPRVAATVGRGFDRLVGAAVDGLAHMCLTCSGTGRAKCAMCNGTGMRSVQCLMCRGTGQVPCPRCAGTKRALVGETMAACPVCAQKGTVKCVPCDGKGELVQGCQFCDANHMVTCPDCGGTGREAVKAHEMVTAPEPIPRFDTPKDRKQRMEWLFDICTSRQDHYAMFAAASCYKELDDYKPHAEIIAARMDEAKEGIAREQEAAEEQPEKAPEEYTIIKTVDGKTIIGKVAEDTPTAVAISVESGGKSVKRIILKKTIASMEKEAAQVGGNAQVMLSEAARLLDEDKDIEALSLMGKLTYLFPDTDVVKDEKTQKRIIADASAKTFMALGGTLKALLADAVKRVESICPECEGKGKFVCDACKGSGTRLIPCKWCRGSKRIFCDRCGGSGREGGETPQDEKQCGKCGGTGWMNCKYCNMKGTQTDRCDRCKGAGEIKCKACGGKGRIDGPARNP